LPTVPTETRFVFLMHPKEFKREKAGTGRLTHLCLPQSEIQVGVAFDEHPGVRRILADPSNHVVLLYPGRTAVNLSEPEANVPMAPDKQLVVLVLDATWSCARKMLKLSPGLQCLSRVMFTPSAPSRFVIKQQPFEGCLSTLESTCELLMAMNARGLEDVPEPERLLGVLDRMQALQVACARDPDRGGYRRGEYGNPGERKPLQGKSARRRANYFLLPQQEGNPKS
jgi:DTW domain-containing protein YfiP